MFDRELGCNGLLLIGNTVPIRSQGAVVGAICTFRDKTGGQPIAAATGRHDELCGCPGTTSHEFMNKLHVILGLLNMKKLRQTRGIRAADRPPLPGGHRRHSTSH